MSDTANGGLSRARKQGHGEIIISPELIREIQEKAPHWKDPKKILDLFDRALPLVVADEHLISFSLPGGQSKIHIPVSIHKNEETERSLLIKPHEKRSVKIKDT